MRYFTRELWRGLQRPEALDDSLLRYQQAFEEYGTQLESLRSRLSQDAYQFFRDADVHDGELLELHIADGSRPAPLTEAVRPWTSPGDYPVEVALTVLDASEKLVWHISYKAVRRLLIDYPTDTPLFYSSGEGFGDWGHHELTDAGSGFLRHEVLFSTGAILLFEFVDIGVSSVERSLGSA
jgi:hypothetical protein